MSDLGLFSEQWLVRTALAGGAVLLAGVVWMLCARQPARRQWFGETALLCSLIVAALCALPAWLPWGSIPILPSSQVESAPQITLQSSDESRLSQQATVPASAATGNEAEVDLMYVLVPGSPSREFDSHEAELAPRQTFASVAASPLATEPRTRWQLQLEWIYL